MDCNDISYHDLTQERINSALEHATQISWAVLPTASTPKPRQTNGTTIFQLSVTFLQQTEQMNKAPCVPPTPSVQPGTWP
eukprot:364173-Chlamydomonas_euryale.AAC.12